jgi:hypothetical protein
MSRDVLLAFLALALLLNLAFLGVVMVRPRRRGAPMGGRGRAGRAGGAGGWRAEPPRRASASRTLARPSATARPGGRFFVPAPANGFGHSATSDPASRAGRATAPGIAVAAMLATPRAESPRHAPAVTPMRPPAVGSVPPGPPVAPPEAASVGAVEQGPETRASKPKSRRTRGRRFVLPPLDEDQGRSAAAIEAFLGGEPPPGTTAERHQRRRHRARRPTGSPVPRTTMLVWLQGFGELDRVVGTSRASHVSNAFFDALRRLARTTDEVREVGTGRVRVVIDADDAGASAYVERARASVQPWLELLTVPLRVETGARESTEVFPFGTSRRVAGDH